MKVDKRLSAVAAKLSRAAEDAPAACCRRSYEHAAAAVQGLAQPPAAARPPRPRQPGQEPRMPSRARRWTSAPRVKLQPNGRTTVAGLNYEHLRSILTQAWLYCDQQRKEGRDPAYYENSLKVIDAVKASVDEAIAATHPRREPTIAERRQRVEESLRFNRLFHQVIEQHFAAMPEGEIP